MFRHQGAVRAQLSLKERGSQRDSNGRLEIVSRCNLWLLPVSGFPALLFFFLLLFPSSPRCNLSSAPSVMGSPPSGGWAVLTGHWGLTGYYISPLLVAPNTPRQARRRTQRQDQGLWKRANKGSFHKKKKMGGNAETTAGESEAAPPPHRPLGGGINWRPGGETCGRLEFLPVLVQNMEKRKWVAYVQYIMNRIHSAK